MGVYINGMEMPTKENAVILITPSGDVWMIGDMPNEDTHLVKAKAVSVQPHGRLKDVDALDYTMLYKENWIRGTGIEAPGVWKSDIDAAPTIIPASGGKEDE